MLVTSPLGVKALFGILYPKLVFGSTYPAWPLAALLALLSVFDSAFSEEFVHGLLTSVIAKLLS